MNHHVQPSGTIREDENPLSVPWYHAVTASTWSSPASGGSGQPRRYKRLVQTWAQCLAHHSGILDGMDGVVFWASYQRSM